MRFVHFATLLCCITIVSGFSGCGKPKNPDGRQDVSGKITLNGGPFEGAMLCSIAFIQIDDPSLGSSSGTFNGNTGKYLLTKQDGLKPGKYKVAISAQAVYDKTTKKPVTPETLEGNDYIVRLVPPKFNKESTIEFEVVEGKKNVFNYDVVTDFVPTP